MFQYIQLEELVPQGHLLRRIRAVLDLKAIYKATEGCYSANRGRLSVDPTVAFRMMLLGYLFNLPERRLCEDLQMHAGYRWFCGLDFNQKVPDRTTLVKLRRHQWGEAVFREVMRAGVQQCIDVGLVKGSAVVVDGSELRARAAVKSLEAVAPEQSVDEFVDQVVREDAAESAAPQGPADPKEPPSDGGTNAASAVGEPRKAGDENFHGEKFTNETHRSKTDPDARLFRKGNTGATLSYLVHNAMDLKSGVILAREGARGRGRWTCERPRETARTRPSQDPHRAYWAEAKECHGMRRAKGLGLEMMNIQALMTATVQNLRRLSIAPPPPFTKSSTPCSTAPGVA
jgi:transposase